MSGILGDYTRGLSVAAGAKQGQMASQAFMDQTQTRNKLAAFLTPENMAGLMSGDANALAGYAAASGNPMDALKMQQQVLQTQGAGLSNQATEQSMDIQRKKFEFEVTQQAAQMTAEQRAQAANKTRQAVQAGMTVQTPEQWDQLATQMGQTDLVGQFEYREGLLATYLDAAVIMERFDEQNAEPEPYQPQSTQGKFYADQQAGALPKGTQFDGGGVNIQNNVGASESEFSKTLGKKEGEKYASLLNAGMTVDTRLAQVDQIEALLGQSPSGIEAAFKYAAGELGIATEGLDNLQAAQAMINKLVPSQRQPGSGPMSDADLALFKASLPRLINQPGGNAIISQTMRGLLIYEKMQANIANKVAAGELKPAEGNKALSELQNPLQAFKKQGQTTIGGYKIKEIK